MPPVVANAGAITARSPVSAAVARAPAAIWKSDSFSVKRSGSSQIAGRASVFTPESGPLSTLVSFEAGRQAAEIHEISFNALVALIGLHIAAVAVYLIFFKDNLIRPMVTGRRASEDFGDVSLSDAKLSWLRLAIAVAVALAAMWGISNAG